MFTKQRIESSLKKYGKEFSKIPVGGATGTVKVALCLCHRHWTRRMGHSENTEDGMGIKGWESVESKILRRQINPLTNYSVSCP